MTLTNKKRAIACLLISAAAIFTAASALDREDRARAAGVSATPNPMAGAGMWIWYVSKAQGGDPRKIAAVARRRGIEVVLIKSGDGSNRWSQFTPTLVRALKARGIRVCAWQFVYGDLPYKEANVGASAVRRGADCLVIDAEGHYEGRYPQASTYMRRLRALVGPDYPIGLSSFPYTDYHPALPYSVFLGPGGAQYVMPQLYWKTIGDPLDKAFVHTYVFNRAYGREILPTGQVYLNPKPAQIRRFRRLAIAHRMPGIAWWSWQHSRKRQWKAVGRKRLRKIPGYRTYDSYPFLREGSKGDLVAWAQQLLRGGGYAVGITGYFTSGVRSKVLKMQSDHGLARTGNIDKPTWDVLLTFEPFAVRWTKKGAVAASDNPHVLPSPRSAKLPAVRYEIPRWHGRG